MTEEEYYAELVAKDMTHFGVELSPRMKLIYRQLASIFAQREKDFLQYLQELSENLGVKKDIKQLQAELKELRIDSQRS